MTTHRKNVRPRPGARKADDLHAPSGKYCNYPMLSPAIPASAVVSFLNIRYSLYGGQSGPIYFD